MAGIDDRHPWDDYENLFELEQYDPEMLNKPHLIAANKMDEDTASPNLKEFRNASLKSKSWKSWPLSTKGCRN